tara:strand:- start:31 stop:1005 length:975 start_codon:yes stop_codon:yes gene_type:complete
MGLGHQAISLFDIFLENKELIDCKSVIEIGSQEIPEASQPYARNILDKYNKKTKKGSISAKDFYHSLGFTEYNSIDADGKRGSLVFDMNEVLIDHYKFNKTYDLITNFGTTEHVFNQKNVFENIHNLAKKDGYLFHLLPFEGDFNHCYYNYHPKFFYDLAQHNNYQIKGFWYFSTRHTKVLKSYSGYNLTKPLIYNNDLMKFIDKLVQENKLINSPIGGSSLGVLYKKVNSEKFRVPFDIQEDTIDNKLKHYNNEGENVSLNINLNVDHQKQIDEVLGSSYWKIILKRAILNNDNYRKKLLAKIIYKFSGYKNKNFNTHSIFND